MSSRYPVAEWRQKKIHREVLERGALSERIEAVQCWHFLREEAQELAGHLRGLASGEVKELRMHLPLGWTAYWKIRDEAESRLLLSHPEPNEWVMTCMLAQPVLQGLAEHLERAEAGSRLNLSELAPVHFLSNIDLSFQIGAFQVEEKHS